ncbi:hypothetical protein BVRB_5g127110 [Beta vulgaris subsp. vulgaris]|uniref:Uncharacterized protein n=1 Tax=Beta vulgaris subsp. vulgaris TaxID=3555 RepID=A0A0J8B8Y4_BETVV|nr:hypothetical protein BVRB_5g127110 [Beta vulgaris subsp. vulgaris]
MITSTCTLQLSISTSSIIRLMANCTTTSVSKTPFTIINWSKIRA